MTWSKPDFVEIILGMEATAYVNTDQEASGPVPLAREAEAAPPARTTDH